MSEPSAIVNPRSVVCAQPATVLANRALCREHVAIDLRLPKFPPSDPGQFLELLCAAPDENAPLVHEWREGDFPALDRTDWRDRTPFLRRPFSIADRADDVDGVRLCVISRNIGPGTAWLERLIPGATLDLTGPLGRGFRIPDACDAHLLVGGGVGIPPMLYLARRLHEQQRQDVCAIFGATSGDLLPLERIASPDEHGVPRVCVRLPGDAPFGCILTTDDGSLGLRGRVTDGLAAWQRQNPRRRPMVCACGPERMLEAVARFTQERDWDCQLCIERNMGCGLGTCLSCVVRVRDASRSAGWRWALACSEGPCFERDALYS